jgi:uncharacterized protein YxeA
MNMKTAIAIVSSVLFMAALGLAGCSEEHRDRDRVYVERERTPVIIERERAPVVIERRDAPRTEVRVEIERH